MQRSELVRRMKDHLERRRRPRAVLSAIVILAGLVGFGASYVLLSYGIASMAVRYAIAGTAAYLSFIGLLRVWASTHGSDALDTALDLDQFVSIPPGGRSSERSADIVADVESGGAGASSSWDANLSSPVRTRTPKRSRSSGSIDFDTDDAVWILVLVAAIASGVIALGFVVYSAPVLLAEVIVDTVIVSAVYHRVAVKDTRYWAATVVRRTWIAAFVIIVSLMAGGYALQQLVPEARSIGPALNALAKRI